MKTTKEKCYECYKKGIRYDPDCELYKNYRRLKLYYHKVQCPNITIIQRDLEKYHHGKTNFTYPWILEKIIEDMEAQA